MFSAYAKFWKGYVDFTGRSSRSDYWFAVLCNVLIYLVFAVVFGIVAAITGVSTYGSNQAGAAAAGILTVFLLIRFVFGLAIVLPSIANVVRRLRDAGFHWAFIFLNFVPFGFIAVIIMLCQPTKVEATFNNNFNNPNQP